MREHRKGIRWSRLWAGLLVFALMLPGAAAEAMAPGDTLGLPAGTSAETATPTPTEAPPTATNTRVPTFALIDRGGCAIAAVPAAAPTLPFLAVPLVLWVTRRRRRSR